MSHIANAQRQMAVPFRIDGEGGIAYEEVPEQQIFDRILMLLNTMPGERVMRPGSGVNVRSFLWDPSDGLAVMEMVEGIKKAIATAEPSIQDVVVQPRSTVEQLTQGQVHVDVEFSLRTEVAIRRYFGRIEIGGTVTEVVEVG